MSSTVIYRHARREPDTALQRFVRCELSVILLQLLAYINQLSPRLNYPLGKSTNLTLNFSTLTQELNVLLYESLFGFKLFVRDSGDFVLLDLVRSIALELVVGEFVFCRHGPAL